MGGRVVVFEARIAKSADKLLIIIPRSLHKMVEHGRKYIVELKPIDDP